MGALLRDEETWQGRDGFPGSVFLPSSAGQCVQDLDSTTLPEPEICRSLLQITCKHVTIVKLTHLIGNFSLKAYLDPVL